MEYSYQLSFSIVSCFPYQNTFDILGFLECYLIVAYVDALYYKLPVFVNFDQQITSSYN
jgi:hypothetical protein